MKKRIFSSFVAVALLSGAQTSMAKENTLAECRAMTDAAQKGYCFARHVDRLPVIEKQLSQGKLKIYDTQGKLLFTKKTRQASYHSQFNNPDTRLRRSLAYFYAPADDKGNGSLVKEIKGEDDDQFLYLKGLRKPKRVIGSDKSSSYMGSDLSNGDLSPGDLDEYTYKWLATEKMSTVYRPGKKSKKITLAVEKIERSFKSPKKQEDYGYSKTVVWMNPKTGLPFKVENYNMSGQLYKTAITKSFIIKRNKDKKKVYIPTEVLVKNVIKGTKTVMQVGKIKVEKKASSVKAGIFKTSYLTRRWW